MNSLDTFAKGCKQKAGPIGLDWVLHIIQGQADTDRAIVAACAAFFLLFHVHNLLRNNDFFVCVARTKKVIILFVLK